MTNRTRKYNSRLRDLAHNIAYTIETYRGHFCSKKNATFARELGCSVRTIQYHLKVLKSLGVITTSKTRIEKGKDSGKEKRFINFSKRMMIKFFKSYFEDCEEIWLNHTPLTINGLTVHFAKGENCKGDSSTHKAKCGLTGNNTSTNDLPLHLLAKTNICLTCGLAIKQWGSILRLIKEKYKRPKMIEIQAKDEDIKFFFRIVE